MTLEKYLDLTARTLTPLFLWGDPGIGKTARIEQWARREGYHYERIVLSLHDPTEVAGIYVATEGGRRAERAVPAWLARVLEAAKRGQRSVVFFDELTAAPETVQVTALGIFAERVVGEVPLPEETILVAAANPAGRVDGLWELSSALTNRFRHVDLEPDLEGWLAWAKEQSEGHRVVAAFLAEHPQHFHAFPEGIEARAWPSARTWDMVARDVCDQLGGGLPPEDLHRAIRGAVGDASATAFAAWYEAYRSANHVSLEQILADPAGAPVPRRSDVVAQIAENLVERVGSLLEHDTKAALSTYAKATTYLRRVYQAGHKAVALATSQQLASEVVDHEQEEAAARALGEKELAYLETIGQIVAEARAA